jgi:hypothetical protein
MFLINNEPFVNLDTFLDLKSFDDLWENMAMGIGKSYQDIHPAPTPQQTLLDQTQCSYFEKRNKILKDYPNLSFHQANTFAVMCGTSTIGSVLNLKTFKSYPDHYDLKHLEEYTKFTEVSKNFNFLFDWIERQNCFEQYGRTVLFINYAGQRGSIHKDYPTDCRKRKDQFIWLSSKNPKKFFLYDQILEKKYYNSHRSIIFDNCNYHGSENDNDFATWSLRVDGVFKDSWSKHVGVYDHYH